MLPTFAEIAGVKTPQNTDGISVLNAFKGGAKSSNHDYLYWDYAHCRQRNDQAVRMGNWKGIRLGLGNPIQLYDLESDLGETRDLPSEYPEVVENINSIMKSVATLNPRYSIGDLYTGSPIWKLSDHW